MRCPNVPRFYFHVRDDIDASDEQGSELADLDAARAHAIGAARSLMCETLVQDGRITLHHRIDIENENGEVLAPVRFADAVRIER